MNNYPAGKYRNKKQTSVLTGKDGRRTQDMESESGITERCSWLTNICLEKRGGSFLRADQLNFFSKNHRQQKLLRGTTDLSQR